MVNAIARLGRSTTAAASANAPSISSASGTTLPTKPAAIASRASSRRPTSAISPRQRPTGQGGKGVRQSSVGDQSQSGEGRLHAHRLRGDGQVGSRDKRGAVADGQSVHCCDERHVHRSDGLDETVGRRHRALVIRAETIEIGAHAEGAPGTGEDHRPDALIRIKRGQPGFQCRQGVDAEGVERARTVEDDLRHRPLSVHVESSAAHRDRPMSSRMCR